MSKIKVPVLINNSNFNNYEVEYKRFNGSVSTEIHSITQVNGPSYAHWKFNETEGNIINDSSINGRHGSNDGASIVTGKINNGLSFNGINSRLLWDETICDFDWNKVFSIELWLKVNPTSNILIVLCKQSSTGDSTGFNIHIDIDGYVNFVTRYDSSNRLAIEIPKDLRDSTWHHLVVIYGGTGYAADCKMYLDGVDESFLIVNDGMTQSILNNVPFQISGRNTGYMFDGILDEVIIYEKALTEQEILFRYNNGLGREEILGGYPLQAEVLLDDIDGHYSNSIWDCSSLEVFENPNSEGGSIKYQYAYGNASNPVNWNGFWLTKSQLKTQSDVIARFLKLKVLFESDGELKTALGDGFIECDMPLLICDYPSENDVRDGIPYNNGNHIGNIILPLENDVQELVAFGANGNEFIGNIHLPFESEVKENVGYGSNSSEFTGNIKLPEEIDVREDILYGAEGTEFEGNCKLPAEENVQYGISYGANGYEFEGRLIGGDLFKRPLDISFNTEKIIVDVIF